MGARRALVVDDSRAARAFLTQILEYHQLTVDTAASAEEALTYLIEHRPDVIFMDHLMSGMDGLQAVKLIKADSRTATIPILMYTSQEGELYLSQARALGAIGVLPKQTRPADVSKALQNLNLLSIEPESALPPPPASIASPPSVQAMLEPLLADHAASLKAHFDQGLQLWADRLSVELQQRMAERMPDKVLANARRAGVALGLAAAATLAAAALGVLWFNSHGDMRQIETSLRTAQLELNQSRARAAQISAASERLSASAAAVAASANDARVTPLVLPVPFGEVPLSGDRIERIRELLQQLRAGQFGGAVEIRGFVGRFCMSNAPGDAPQLAEAASSYDLCAQVAQALDGSAVAQSADFASMLSQEVAAAAGAFDVRVLPAAAAEAEVEYPELTQPLVAGEWNRIAAERNRIEVHLLVAR